MKLDHINELVRRGWELHVDAVPDVMRTVRPSKFHACVFLHKRGSGHNFIGDTVAEALEGLERYLIQQVQPSGES